MKNQLMWISLGLIDDKVVADNAFREQKLE